MEQIKNVKTTAKERKVDAIVKEQVFDDDAWEYEMESETKSRQTSIRLSIRTITRAKFFARIHHQRGYQSWLKQIIEDRVNTEYELFKRLKRHTRQTRSACEKKSGSTHGSTSR